MYCVFVCAGFTGVDQTYEPPSKPELVLKAGEQTVDECVHHIVAALMDDVSVLFVCLSWTM
jgi:adenylylsulfate kinase-like enzyme